MSITTPLPLEPMRQGYWTNGPGITPEDVAAACRHIRANSVSMKDILPKSPDPASIIPQIEASIAYLKMAYIEPKCLFISRRCESIILSNQSLFYVLSAPYIDSLNGGTYSTPLAQLPIVVCDIPDELYMLGTSYISA